MDKVKSQATQIAEKGKQGVVQGQAKLDAMQAKKQLDGLFRDLGAATYAMERKGGPRDEVDRLLTAVKPTTDRWTRRPVPPQGRGPPPPARHRQGTSASTTPESALRRFAGQLEEQGEAISRAGCDRWRTSPTASALLLEARLAHRVSSGCIFPSFVHPRDAGSCAASATRSR
jgi:hypothetical protein